MQALVEACQQGILKGCYQPVLVFSNRPEAQGLTWAAAQGLATACLASQGLGRAAYDRAVLDLLAPHRLDCLALAGYMRVLGKAFVAAYRGRIFNIHPADTALHQGLGGYQWAWEEGLKETLITVHRVDEGLDTGEVLLQGRVDLSQVGSLAEVEARGLAVEHQLYAQALLKVYDSL